MKFGLNFHAGSRTEAATRIQGAASLPLAAARLALAAIDALGGTPGTLQVAIAGEHAGDALTAIAITVTT